MNEKVDLFIVTGNFGTGKTTTGLKIERQFEASMIDPDLTRKELGITEYRREDNPFVRQKMWEKVGGLWHAGQSVTLCTPCVARRGRERSYDMLQKMSLELGRELQAVLIRCECSEVLAKNRIQLRPREKGYPYPPDDPKSYDKKKTFDEPIHGEEIDRNTNISFLIFDTEKNVLRVLAERENHGNVLATLKGALT